MAASTTPSAPCAYPKVKELNGVITCTLCGGYYIDATTLDCLHSFCRSCILKHFESAKQQSCPTCKKKKTTFRPDAQIQALVYKMVPGLYAKEMQRRDDFYRSTGARANSSCSDDSVLGDLRLDQEKWMAGNKDKTGILFGPDDPISMSLEYYQSHLDTTQLPCDTNSNEYSTNISKSTTTPATTTTTTTTSTKTPPPPPTVDEKTRDVRYLQCPAAVAMTHLHKFIRMKYALSQEHKVEIIYNGEVNPEHFKLMDIAYIFNWKMLKPMRFFYRIFTPLKVQPIKIIKTNNSDGRQLQIVPVKPSNNSNNTLQLPPPEVKTQHTSTPTLPASNDIQPPPPPHVVDEHKERLMAHLKLQSRHKTTESPAPPKPSQPPPPPVIVPPPTAPSKAEHHHHHHHHRHHHTRSPLPPPPTTPTKSSENCVYEYEEPDKEEIKRFAENRDREWARMRDVDETDETPTRTSRKRKKSKHSKNEARKQRKIHAEITSEVVKQEESSIKLKVKLTPHNGHKHKHRPTVTSTTTAAATTTTAAAAITKEETPTKSAEKPTPTLIPIHGSGGPNTHTERQKKTFLKTFQSDTDKRDKQTAIVTDPPAQQQSPAATVEKRPMINTYKRAPKTPSHNSSGIDKKVSFSVTPVTSAPSSVVDKPSPHILNSDAATSRPSLEITLISSGEQATTAKPPPAKRPPPATIPLDRIKKSMHVRLGGLSITPKVVDNVGALDLSKQRHHNGVTTLNGIKSLNGLSKLPSDGINKTQQLSNLQMLSKVASEQQQQHGGGGGNTPNNNNNNNASVNHNKQMPNLHALKIPNLARLPKLNEINKTQFRLLNNSTSSSMMQRHRPSQNQNVRNIPNPSLLVRQQRLNVATATNNNNNNNSNSNASGEQPPPTILNALAGKDVAVAAVASTSNNNNNAHSANNNSSDRKEGATAAGGNSANIGTNK